jgi:hypothetical protein
MYRLDTVVSGPTEPLKSLTEHQRRRVFGIVCTKASELIRDIEPELGQFVNCCGKCTTLSTSEIDAVRRITKWADERYFDLKERGVDEAVWDNWIRKARLATAIGAASGENSWESFAEGLYELSVIFDDLAHFLASFKEGMESAHRLTSPAKGS